MFSMHQKLIHFSVLSSIPLYVNNSLLIQSPVDRHLIYLQFLAVTDKASMNITSLCVYLCFHFSWVNTQVEWLNYIDHIADYIF